MLQLASNTVCAKSGLLIRGRARCEDDCVCKANVCAAVRGDGFKLPSLPLPVESMLPAVLGRRARLFGLLDDERTRAGGAAAPIRSCPSTDADAAVGTARGDDGEAATGCVPSSNLSNRSRHDEVLCNGRGPDRPCERLVRAMVAADGLRGRGCSRGEPHR